MNTELLNLIYLGDTKDLTLIISSAHGDKAIPVAFYEKKGDKARVHFKCEPMTQFIYEYKLFKGDVLVLHNEVFKDVRYKDNWLLEVQQVLNPQVI